MQVIVQILFIMNNYRVIWEIDIEPGESFIDAAQKALELIRKEDSQANVFYVKHKGTGEIKLVDLHETIVEDISNLDTVFTGNDMVAFAIWYRKQLMIQESNILNVNLLEEWRKQKHT
jgi:hypothetical protein